MAGIEIELEIKGMEKIQQKLEREALLGSPLRQTMGRAALVLEREVKIATPVDTGRLRASVLPTISPDSVPLWAKVGTNVKYASYVEYGTVKMDARHVTEGSSVRIKGKGMFAYAFEKVKDKIDALLVKAEELVKAEWEK